MRPTAQQLDRAVGAIIGSAVGDALGAPYEFGPEHVDDWIPTFGPGKGGEAPGGWTDDTAMAMPILEALAGGRGAELERFATDGWVRWFREDGRGVGIQISRVIGATERAGDLSPTSFLIESQQLHADEGRSGGNGSLMRTGPLALGFLDDGEEATLAETARRISRLTHWEADAGDASAIWSLAIRHAIRTGELDIRAQTAWLPAERVNRWDALIHGAAAPSRHPRDFRQDREGRPNGWVVLAFQAALSAVAGAADFRDAIHRAIQGGGDTDTVAAIAGSLAGARWGVSAIPLSWQRRIHGWPGYDANDLARLAILAARRGVPDGGGWPSGDSVLKSGFRHTAPARHPDDPGVWLGSQSALSQLPPSVGAVISLGRLGTSEVPEGIESIRVWLIDHPSENANLDQTLADATDVIAELRAEGKEVFVHCAEARSRTSAVAALYAARHRGVPLDDAWAHVRAVLPYFDPALFLQEAVARVAAVGQQSQT